MQAHQHIKVGDPGDAQGEQDGGRQGPQHDPPPSEPISQTGTDEQGACSPAVQPASVQLADKALTEKTSARSGSRGWVW